MKNVIELEQHEIEQAIEAWVQQKRPDIAVIGATVHQRQAGDYGLQSFANVSYVVRQHEQDAMPPKVEDFDRGELSGALWEGGGFEAASCKVMRESQDFVTGEMLERGVEALWIPGHGITRAAPGQWPEPLRSRALAALEKDASEAEEEQEVELAPFDVEEAAKICGETPVVALARTARDTVDFVTGTTLPEGVDVLFVEDHGVTRAPLEQWPEELREKVESRPVQKGAKKGRSRRKATTAASAARDILGGSGGVMDRSSGLGNADDV